jgi:hypothetical protein
MPYAGQKPDRGDDPGLSAEVGGGLKPPAALRPDTGSLFSSGFLFFRILLFCFRFRIFIFPDPNFHNVLETDTVQDPSFRLVTIPNFSAQTV